MIESLVANFGGFVIKKLGDLTIGFLRRKISQSIDERIRKIIGEIEPQFPRVGIIGQPWMGGNTYYKGLRTDAIPVQLEFEADQRTGLLRLPLADIEGDWTTMPVARAGVIDIRIPQASSVDLESGENFVAGTEARAQIALPSPVKIWTDSVDYSGGVLVVPFKATSQIKAGTIRQIFVPPPQMIPKQATSVILPVNRKTRTAIPILG